MKFTDQCLSIVDLNALCSAAQDLIGISNLMNVFLFFYFLDVSTSYYPLYIGPEESSITDYLSVNLFL